MSVSTKAFIWLVTVITLKDAISWKFKGVAQKFVPGDALSRVHLNLFTLASPLLAVLAHVHSTNQTQASNKPSDN